MRQKVEIEWIPVEDHLPEDEYINNTSRKQIPCLITTKHNGRKYVLEASRLRYDIHDPWHWSVISSDKAVIAWAHPPKAYTETAEADVGGDDIE